jgi:hypothetical protein
MADLKTEKACIFGTHRNSFRAGHLAEIVGVVIANPSGMDSRPAFHVRFPDGKEDYVAIEDAQHYKIISLRDLIEFLQPQVIH